MSQALSKTMSQTAISEAGKTSAANRNRQVFTISGVTCGGCAGSVERVLSRVPGVSRAAVDFSTGRASVEGSATAGELINAVQAAGYGAALLPERE